MAVKIMRAICRWCHADCQAVSPGCGGGWELNINVLTSDDPDRCNPRSGGWPLKTALCRVYKCQTY